MPDKVLRSLQNPAGDQCVDLFVRDDGSYGYEECRRDPEDPRGWFSLRRYAHQAFDSEASALAHAQSTVAWLKDPE
jgi:hypothetical protein